LSCKDQNKELLLRTKKPKAFFTLGQSSKEGSFVQNNKALLLVFLSSDDFSY